MAIKREKVVKMKANFHLQKDKAVKKRHKIINLVHPDVADLTDGHLRIFMMLWNISKP
jgi:hypothetical protein